ncbi:hypothetical protein C3R30_21640, partial [Mycobacterium tuberculosis]
RGAARPETNERGRRATGATGAGATPDEGGQKAGARTTAGPEARGGPAGRGRGPRQQRGRGGRHPGRAGRSEARQGPATAGHGRGGARG